MGGELVLRLPWVAGGQAAVFEPGGQAGGELGGDALVVAGQVLGGEDVFPAAVGPLVEEAHAALVPGPFGEGGDDRALGFHRLEAGGLDDLGHDVGGERDV